jgi:hypothetical protein
MDSAVLPEPLAGLDAPPEEPNPAPYAAIDSVASVVPGALPAATPSWSEGWGAGLAAGLERTASVDESPQPLPPPRRALYGAKANDGGASGGGGGVAVATRHGGSRQGSPRHGNYAPRGSGKSGSSPGPRSSGGAAFEPPPPVEVWLEVPVGDERFAVCRLWAPPREAFAAGGAGGAGPIVELDERRAAASWGRELALEFGLTAAQEAELVASVARQVRDAARARSLSFKKNNLAQLSSF